MEKLLQRLIYLDVLIRRKSTGTPDQLACKLRVSKRTVYIYLNHLKDLGADIAYSPYLQSYYYINDNFIFIRNGKKLF